VSSTRLGLICTLAVAPLFAQVSPQIPPKIIEPSPLLGETRIAPYQLSPIRHRVDHFDGTAESTNWSGYAVTGASFTSAKASWIVPATVCTGVSGDQYASLWVGLDGFDSNTVEQTGTTSYCAGTTPGSYVWFEFYPEPALEVGGFAVNPGNVITASVTYVGNRFTATIANESTGRSYSASASVPGAQRSSAEWVIEAPATLVGRNTEILPLADFGTGFFGFDYTKQSGTNDATDTAVSGPIGAFGSNVYQINKVGSSSSPQSSTCSPLTSDGTSFSCTWAQ
jgi:hypothetical protein